ncbi:MAG: hypothetical protein LBT62_05780 [Deltaproteobacteria bacterium]|jgi:hypothetical protein|nr:hypothetical protein [Deltaproteobacteria bacterium]
MGTPNWAYYPIIREADGERSFLRLFSQVIGPDAEKAFGPIVIVFDIILQIKLSFKVRSFFRRYGALLEKYGAFQSAMVRSKYMNSKYMNCSAFLDFPVAVSFGLL